jgi:hypothetical protein
MRTHNGIGSLKRDKEDFRMCLGCGKIADFQQLICKMCWKKAVEPTTAPPGSAEKIQIMGERARLGISVFNPYDISLKKYKILQALKLACMIRPYVPPWEIKDEQAS